MSATSEKEVQLGGLDDSVLTCVRSSVLNQVAGSAKPFITQLASIVLLLGVRQDVVLQSTHACELTPTLRA